MTLPKVHELEAAVMDLMWSYDGAVCVSDLVKDLRRTRMVPLVLVTKIVNRLYRTGWLRRELVDGTYFYEPTASREEFADRLMRDALGSDRNPASAFVVHLPSARSIQMPIRCALR